MTSPAALPRLLTPAATLGAFTEALAAAQLSAATSCFCREARLITADRTAVAGRPDISRILAQLIERRARLQLDNLVSIDAGEVSLTTADLTVHSPRPEGVLHTQRSRLTAVLRLVEGDCKLAILDPWGEPAPDPR